MGKGACSPHGQYEDTRVLEGPRIGPNDGTVQSVINLLLPQKTEFLDHLFIQFSR